MDYLSNDIKQLRIDAGLTQNDLAQALDIPQSQVSRYEENPDAISFGLLKKWQEICGKMLSVQKKIEINDPRIQFNYKLEQTIQYLKDTDSTLEDDSIYLNKINDLCEVLRTKSAKKKIGVFGQFDAGKTRLINELLGTNDLPTSYQPTTSVICLIKHMKDKPDWQQENVWLMKKGFDLNRANDQKHCETYNALAGGYDALSLHGIHQLSNKEQNTLNIYSAIVYVDSPILLAVDLIDLPGYGNDENDSNKAEMAHQIADGIIYVSTYSGFMNKTDISCFSSLIRQVPNSDLNNIFFVASRAHMCNTKDGSDISEMLDKANHRVYQTATIFEKEMNIEEAQLRRRFFSFSAENSTISKEFISTFKDYIINNIPNSQLEELHTILKNFKGAEGDRVKQSIQSLENLLDDRASVLVELEKLKERQPEIINEFQIAISKTSNNIEVFKQGADAYIQNLFGALTIEQVEATISKKYADKKTAQEYAANYILNNLESDINTWNKKQAKILSDEISSLMENFNSNLNTKHGNSQKLDIDFDSTAAFMGALSGVGTVGALSIWAGIVAGGSNLGGYILVGKIVGWLSSIGISLGSSATVMSAVSAIGGPVTLAIGAGIIAAISIFSIFGDSWQKKLAKKIVSHFKKNNVQEKYSNSVNEYWNQTLVAFKKATLVFEEEFIKSIQQKEAELNMVDNVSLEIKLISTKKYYDFIQKIPSTQFF